MNYVLKDFGKLLKHNHQKFRRLFTPLQTDCYRVYDRNIGSLDISVDMYGSYVYITDYREKTDTSVSGAEKLIDTASRMLYVKTEQVIYKSREIRKGVTQHKKLDNIENLITVQENGLKFLVNLTDYIDTGLFPDHRKTREMIRDSALRKRVLNLFAYTGSFSVYAAAGGAEVIDTVDLSEKYLKWAEQNLELNGLSSENYSFIPSDIGAWLREAAKSDKRYDIIIIDPPTFSNSRKMDGTFDIQRDYVSIICRCMDFLDNRGMIVFSTNFSKFHFDSGRLKNIKTKEISQSTKCEDFSKKHKPHRCWIIEQQ